MAMRVAIAGGGLAGLSCAKSLVDADEFSAFNLLGWIHHAIYDLPHALAGGYRGARDQLIFAPLAA